MARLETAESVWPGVWRYASQARAEPPPECNLRPPKEGAPPGGSATVAMISGGLESGGRQAELGPGKAERPRERAHKAWTS